MALECGDKVVGVGISMFFLKEVSKLNDADEKWEWSTQYELILPTLSKYRFLNWAPGPLDTTMFHYIKGLIEIQSWILIFDTLGKMIETDTNAEMWKTMKPLKPKFSAEQLFELLKRNQE